MVHYVHRDVLRTLDPLVEHVEMSNIGHLYHII